MKILKVRESSTTGQAVVHYSHLFSTKQRLIKRVQGAWYWLDNGVEVPEKVAKYIRRLSHD